MSADDLIDWIAYHANKQDRDWEYLRKELLRRVSQPSPSGDELMLFDELGCLAGQVELLAESGDVGYLPQIKANGSAILRGLTKLRDKWLRSHDAKVSGQAEQGLKKSLLDMLHNHGCESGPCNACKSARAALQESPSDK